MDRRTCLKLCAGVGAAIGPAGCTEATLESAKEQPPWADPLVDESEFDLPVTTEFDHVAEGIERSDGEEFAEPAEFEGFLDGAGLPVETVEEAEAGAGTILELEYVAERIYEGGNAHSLGLVAGGYAALVRGDWDGDELSATMLDSDGVRFGEFEVLTPWAEDYNDGAISAPVYGGEVVHTSKTV